MTSVLIKRGNLNTERHAQSKDYVKKQREQVYCEAGGLE